MRIQRRSVEVEEPLLVSYHIAVAAPGARAVGIPGVLEQSELLNREQPREIAGIHVVIIAFSDRATESCIRKAGDHGRLWIKHFFRSYSVGSADGAKLVSRRIVVGLEFHSA